MQMNEKKVKVKLISGEDKEAFMSFPLPLPPVLRIAVMPIELGVFMILSEEYHEQNPTIEVRTFRHIGPLAFAQCDTGCYNYIEDVYRMKLVSEECNHYWH